MTTLLPSMRTRMRRTALRLAARRAEGIDVSSLRAVPAAWRFPLQRDALDPVPALAEARSRGEVVRLARLLGTDVWLVTGHAAARTVLSDSDSFGNDVRHLFGRQGRTPAEQIGGLGMTDDPEHQRLRRVLTPEFTRRRLARLDEAVSRVVADCLDDLEAHGPEVDLVERFGFAVPFRVICELLGLPEVDRDEFRRRGSARFDLTTGGLGPFAATAGTREFLIDLVARERRSPFLPDGLLAGIIAQHGHELDDVEIGGLADGVFVGGYETSASMLSLGAYVLCRDPVAHELVRTGSPEQVDAVVEELLRYICPVQVAFPRFARRPVTVAGVPMSQGDLVVVSLSAAGRDPAVRPDRGDFDPLAAPGGQLAFGHGMHRCVGAELARMELRAGLVGLTRRFPAMQVSDPAELRFTELSIVYGLEALPVRLA
ncbi:cytochrome P450 [Nocardioides campestrisoli]|uniref:cytochrome P450 n=1 Tax=Nocardioides campestrisoli TaxID=2736757 RepID=UPI00215A09BE|nr:cytochrome P450 [Nocardioides campestrisoli]